MLSIHLINLGFNRDFYIQPLCKPILLLGGSSNFIVKVINSLYDMPEMSTNCFATYHPHYKEKPEITKPTYDLFPFQPSPKLVSLSGISSDCIVKVITIYHLYYKNKLFSNATQTFVYNANCFFNFLAAFLCNCNGDVRIAESGIKKPLRTSLILHSNTFQILFLILSLTFSKYIAMSKW